MRQIWLLMVVFAVFLIVPVVASNPSLVSYLESNVYISGKVVVYGDVQRVDLNLTIPQNTTNQNVSCNTDVISIGGNQFAHLEFVNPRSTIKYSVVCHVKTRYQEITQIPSTYDITPYEDYTKPSEGVPSDDPRIKELAENITKDARTDFEKLARLTEWVHDYIRYDPGVTGEYLDTYQILNERRGVCVEYSTLFAALARSLGYPTRFVGGLAEGDQGLTGHMWVEVYLGKWVPFDPTWGLGGSIDATHIPFYKSNDRIVESKISYTSTSGSVDWIVTSKQGADFFHSGLGDLFVKDEVVGKFPVSYNVILPSKVIGFNTSTMLFMNLTSDRFLIVPVTLANCTGKQVIVIDHPEKMVILEPDKTRIIGWKITSSTLNPNYVYTCPLTINSRLLEVKSVPIEVKSIYPPSFSVSLSERDLDLGDKFYVYIKSGLNQKFYIWFNDNLETVTGKDITAEIRADSAGDIPLYVVSGNGGVFETSVDVRVPSEVGISRLLVNNKLLVGERAPVEVLLRNPTGKSIKVEARLVSDGLLERKMLYLPDNRLVTFNVSFDSPGFHQITVEIHGDGIYDKKTAIVDVFEKPDIELQSQAISNQVLSLVFRVKGNPVNASISVDGKQYPFSTDFQIQLDQGEHNLVVTWYDEEGNAYKKSVTLDVKPQASQVDMFILLFIAILAIAVVLIIIALFLIIRGISSKKAQ